MKTMQPGDDFCWKDEKDAFIVSPRRGGRIVSWRHGGSGELVKQVGLEDGGLLRMMLGEERYPGTSFNTPHLTRVLRNDAHGFTLYLRHYWNTSNAIARRLGWNDKVNPVYLDGLLLDKTVAFDAATATVSVELEITNLTEEVRRITPWLQSHFHGWVQDTFVTIGGEKRKYLWEDVPWAGHRAEAGKSMRLISVSQEGSLAVVLGAGTEWLAGMASYSRADYFAKDSTEGCVELRGVTLAIPPRQGWRGTLFLALTEGRDGWEKWADAAPIKLEHRLGGAREPGWDPAALLPVLGSWALPEERANGLMVLSHLDKVPFTSANRRAASNSFSQFQADPSGTTAHATVTLFPLQPFDAVQVEVAGGSGWRVIQPPRSLTPFEPVPLVLEGPLGLEGREGVEVRLSQAGQTRVSLRIESDAAIEPVYAFQIKQCSTYLDERWKAEKGAFSGTAAAFEPWREAARGRLRKWMEDAVTAPVPLAARVVERQTGPFCIREKVLIRTEQDLWIPSYLIRPRRIPAGIKMPAILFPHGSGPGKSSFAPDENGDEQNPALLDQWPSPYQFAHKLGCLVLIPDRRGWGEWSEANHGQSTQSAWAAGYNLKAMDMWDYLRAVDYLVQRPDVDTARIVSMGSSGGGWATTFVMGADPRVAGGIVSSSLTTPPRLPDQYFFQMSGEGVFPVVPGPEYPLALGTIHCLAAPRPLWLMDGWDDPCFALATLLPQTEEKRQAALGKWRAENDAGRAEIARIYRLLGAEGRYQATWFQGLHLAGFTFNNIARWLKENFAIS